jgi:hypothetical protein
LCDLAWKNCCRVLKKLGALQALASSQVETLEIRGIGESGRFMVKAADCLIIDPLA